MRDNCIMTNPMIDPACIITTTRALRDSFTDFPAERDALSALDSALDSLLNELLNSSRADFDSIDYLADDFHADPFCYLDLDIDSDDDSPITIDSLRAMIANELAMTNK